MNVWCDICQRLIDAGHDATVCNGCISSYSVNTPPSKYIKPKQEEKKMIITIIGSMKMTETMDGIKKHFEKLGCQVNSPNDPDLQKLPLLEIQKTWIEKIEEADLIVVVSKDVKTTANGGSTYVFEIGESTSYEMAIAHKFHKRMVYV